MSLPGSSAQKAGDAQPRGDMSLRRIPPENCLTALSADLPRWPQRQSTLAARAAPSSPCRRPKICGFPRGHHRIQRDRLGTSRVTESSSPCDGLSIAGSLRSPLTRPPIARMLVVFPAPVGRAAPAALPCQLEAWPSGLTLRKVFLRSRSQNVHALRLARTRAGSGLSAMAAARGGQSTNFQLQLPPSYFQLPLQPPLPTSKESFRIITRGLGVGICAFSICGYSCP